MGNLKAGRFGRTVVELASSRLVLQNFGRTGSIHENCGNFENTLQIFEIRIAPHEQI